MSELADLIAQRDEILKKLRRIELQEHIPNEESIALVQKLTSDQSRLLNRQGEVQAQLQRITAALDDVKNEIAKRTKPVKERILEAIAKQRWFWFDVSARCWFDSHTGLVWPDVKMFYTHEQVDSAINSDLSIFDNGIFENWKIPTYEQFKEMLADKTFPSYNYNGIAICKEDAAYWPWRVLDSNGIPKIICAGSVTNTTPNHQFLELIPDQSFTYNGKNSGALMLPVNTYFVDIYDSLSSRLSPSSNTDRERSQLLFEIFTENKLMPNFDDSDVRTLYEAIYKEKPELTTQLNDLQTKIEKLRIDELLSSEFDYTILLKDYDLPAIDNSVVKYYRAVQRWIEELLGKLDYYAQEMAPVIRDFNQLCSRLAKDYEASQRLSDAENTLLADRQLLFQQKFSLSLAGARQKLLAVKVQADNIERRLDEIDSGDDAIHELAALDQEARAPFSLVAENTAKIITTALQKIEYFQAHHDFVRQAVDIWEKWTEDYRVFKTTYRVDLKAACEADSIEESEWEKWYSGWQGLRFAIEEKIQPIIERGLQSPILGDNGLEADVPTRLVAALYDYKKEIDKFFIEERKGIYQKFAFDTGGDLQEKFETESELYKRTAALQNALQEIIFSCAKAEDRIFILKWANSLLDLQIDEILQFVADNDLLENSEAILAEFSALKLKNYETYLVDAEAYAAEKSRREKEYNSLMYKIRKDLAKK